MKTTNVFLSLSTGNARTSAFVFGTRVVTLVALIALAPDAISGASPHAAKVEPAHVDVIAACPDPITLHLRVASAYGHGSESTVASCGVAINSQFDVDDATSLFVHGSHGILDVDLRLRDGEREASYRATGLQPGVGEVRLQRTSDNGTDVWAWSTRTSGGDFVAVDVVNMTASDIAERLARAKGLQIDDLPRYGKARLTLKWARVPLDAVFEFLGDVTEADVRRLGARHYLVRTQPKRPELHNLYVAVNGTDPKEIEAGWEKIVALAGTPTRGEDVYAFHFRACAALAAIALEHNDLDKAQALFRRSLALAELHDPGGHDTFHATTLVQLATVESKLGHHDTALAQLLQAQQIVTDNEGADGDSMAGVLRKMAAVQHEMHDRAAEAALLDRALAVAKPDTQAAFMISEARRLTKENLLDRADAVLQRVYPAIKEPDPGSGIDSATTEAFDDAVRELASAYRKQKRFADVEGWHRRKIALYTRRWGADSPSPRWPTTLSQGISSTRAGSPRPRSRWPDTSGRIAIGPSSACSASGLSRG